MENLEEDYQNWYILQTQNTRELKTQEMINILIESGEINSILKTYIPTQDVISISPKGKKTILCKPIFPGYIFIKMNYLNQDVVTILGLPFTQKIVGEKSLPFIMSEKEVVKILSHEDKEKQTVYRISFEKGDNVRVLNGPFTNYKAEVEYINHDQNEAGLIVKILGRETKLSVALHDLEIIE